MKRYAAIVMGVLVLVAWWLWTPGAADVTPPASSVAVQRGVQPKPTRTVMAPRVVPDAPTGDVNAPDTARRDFQRRLAAHTGELLVGCYVGEELAGMGAYADGWYWARTHKRQGEHTFGAWDDAHRIVRWDAPEGATEVRCVVDPPAYGHVTVHVRDEQGHPVEGVLLHGCGVFYETREDGVVEFPVLVGLDVCVLRAERAARELHYMGYVRVLPMRKDESRTYHLTVGALEREAGEGSWHMDEVALREGDDLPVTGIPDAEWRSAERADEIEEEPMEWYRSEIEWLEEKLSFYESFRADTPEDERWVIDEMTYDWEVLIEKYRVKMDALEASVDEEREAAP